MLGYDKQNKALKANGLLIGNYKEFKASLASIMSFEEHNKPLQKKRFFLKKKKQLCTPTIIFKD
jgi:hypothetical protein